MYYNVGYTTLWDNETLPQPSVFSSAILSDERSEEPKDPYIAHVSRR
jgi:hypothetical protein